MAGRSGFIPDAASIAKKIAGLQPPPTLPAPLLI
jgi:hypothetical protein